MTKPPSVFSLLKYINVSCFAWFQTLKALLDLNCNPWCRSVIQAGLVHVCITGQNTRLPEQHLPQNSLWDSCAIQCKEMIHWFNFPFKLTQIPTSHLLPEFGEDYRESFGCDILPQHTDTPTAGFTAAGPTQPLPSPALMEGTRKGTKNPGLFGISTFLPGLELAGGRMRERRLEFGKAAGPSGTAFNYHKPQTQ